MIDIFIDLKKYPRKTEASKLAPIAVVMLPEAFAFEAQPQHLNGKRDLSFHEFCSSASKKIIAKNVKTFYDYLLC